MQAPSNPTSTAPGGATSAPANASPASQAPTVPSTATVPQTGSTNSAASSSPSVNVLGHVSTLLVACALITWLLKRYGRRAKPSTADEPNPPLSQLVGTFYEKRPEAIYTIVGVCMPLFAWSAYRFVEAIIYACTHPWLEVLEEAFTKTSSVEFLGVFGALIAIIVGFIVTVIIDHETSSKLVSASKKIEAAEQSLTATSATLTSLEPEIRATSVGMSSTREKLDKTHDKLDQTHDKLDSLARLKPVSSFQQVLVELQKILNGCILDPGTGERRSAWACRDLYILNPTEWFGTTMSFNLDAILDCTPLTRRKALETEKHTQKTLISKIDGVMEQIRKSRKNFKSLAENKDVKVHYAVLAPSDPENSDLSAYRSKAEEHKLYQPIPKPNPSIVEERTHTIDTLVRGIMACITRGTDTSSEQEIASKEDELRAVLEASLPIVEAPLKNNLPPYKKGAFYREYLEPLVASSSVVEPIDGASEADPLRFATDAKFKDNQVYVVPSKRFGDWKDEEQRHELDFGSNSNGLETMALGLNMLQWDSLRDLYTSVARHNTHFYVRLLDEVPFHIFMNIRQGEAGVVDAEGVEGDCLFVFANKYNLPRVGGVAGFTTSDPKLLSAFRSIYRAVVKTHDVFKKTTEKYSPDSDELSINGSVAQNGSEKLSTVESELPRRHSPLPFDPDLSMFT